MTDFLKKNPQAPFEAFEAIEYEITLKDHITSEYIIERLKFGREYGGGGEDLHSCFGHIALEIHYNALELEDEKFQELEDKLNEWCFIKDRKTTDRWCVSFVVTS